ncbi:MAG: hypothetical protein HS115_16450 [Spirochaetales bacterium]|nr:hypothetical protein [Spirochaetales bacterium]
MTAALERIPPLLRRILYALPLLFLWIVGLTWDKDERSRKAAGQSLVANLLYFIWLFFLIFLDSLLAMIGIGETYQGWSLYYLQIFGALLYLIALLLILLEKGTLWIELLRLRLIGLFD